MNHLMAASKRKDPEFKRFAIFLAARASFRVDTFREEDAAAGHARASSCPPTPRPHLGTARHYSAFRVIAPVPRAGPGGPASLAPAGRRERRPRQG